MTIDKWETAKLVDAILTHYRQLWMAGYDEKELGEYLALCSISYTGVSEVNLERDEMPACRSDFLLWKHYKRGKK